MDDQYTDEFDLRWDLLAARGVVHPRGSADYLSVRAGWQRRMARPTSGTHGGARPNAQAGSWIATHAADPRANGEEANHANP